MNFFELSLQTIKMIFTETPREIFLFLGAVFVIAFIIALFRKKLRSTILLLLILFFVLLTSHIPGFVVQYQQTLGGVCTGFYKSIEVLKKNAIQKEIDSRDEILVLSENHKNCITILEELHNSKGIKKYKVFMRNLDPDVYQSTINEYSWVIVLDRISWIPIVISAAVGFFLWLLILLLFPKRKKKSKE